MDFITVDHYLSFQLDSLSREDLVKYVRKQAQLLQKTKAKCDGKEIISSSCGSACQSEPFEPKYDNIPYKLPVKCLYIFFILLDYRTL